MVAVQFLCEGSTVSGVDFEITSAGYRVSLVKKRIVTGMCPDVFSLCKSHCTMNISDAYTHTVF